MPESNEPRPPKILSSAPVLCTTAIKPMIEYFVEKLGFALQGQAGDPPSWASLQRDGVEIMLICGNYPAPAQDWAAYLYMTNVDALYEEFVARGADVPRLPQDKPYNSREIEVRLPDGRVLAFGA
ncbi:MAG: hypothetical protein K2P95_06575 [Hyphomonadaceae bacterium]|nr:hypothetical protein [Hyphomonadaceae bacterium]